MKKLVIFGVGLIGGSVALALKKQVQAPLCVGVGRNRANLDQAVALGIIDSIASNIATALSDVDMILIAAPVAQTKTILQQIMLSSSIIKLIQSGYQSILMVFKYELEGFYS